MTPLLNVLGWWSIRVQKGDFSEKLFGNNKTPLHKCYHNIKAVCFIRDLISLVISMCSTDGFNQIRSKKSIIFYLVADHYQKIKNWTICSVDNVVRLIWQRSDHHTFWPKIAKTGQILAKYSPKCQIFGVYLCQGVRGLIFGGLYLGFYGVVRLVT